MLLMEVSQVFEMRPSQYPTKVRCNYTSLQVQMTTCMPMGSRIKPPVALALENGREIRHRGKNGSSRRWRSCLIQLIRGRRWLPRRTVTRNRYYIRLLANA